MNVTPETYEMLVELKKKTGVCMKRQMQELVSAKYFEINGKGGVSNEKQA